MAERSTEHLIGECKRIWDDCRYTAEAHHIIAQRKERIALLAKLIPAILAAGSGAAVILGAESWVAWFAVISGAVFGFASIANPDGQAHEHTKAAKEFTVLKHDARSLHKCFNIEMGQNEFNIAVRVLRERYNCIVRYSPKTTEDSFQKAGEKIKAGKHESDFE